MKLYLSNTKARSSEGAKTRLTPEWPYFEQSPSAFPDNAFNRRQIRSMHWRMLIAWTVHCCFFSVRAGGLVAYLAGQLLTFGHGSRPAPVFLARYDGLSLHHELLVAVKLHDVAGAIRRALARGVPVVRRARRLAVDGCNTRHSPASVSPLSPQQDAMDVVPHAQSLQTGHYAALALPGIQSQDRGRRPLSGADQHRSSR